MSFLLNVVQVLFVAIVVLFAIEMIVEWFRD